MLLFPLRLETRFGAGDPPTELWVRVYPDDCLVDSFEDELSDGELDAADGYWIAVWSAAADEDRQRAAWRSLVAAVGSGRAAWITSRYAPLNPPDERPQRAAPTDIFLTVLLRTPLAANERAAVAAYWPAVWRADGDTTRTAAARSELEAAVGAARANALVAETLPANMSEAPAAPLTRADVAAAVAFLLMPPRPAAKPASWTRAATAAMLPDRLVLLGYVGGQQVVEALGAPLPARVVVGPDPASPPHGENGQLEVPDELRWLVDFDRAVQDGLGFRVALDQQTKSGLDRLVVLGLRSSVDRTTTKAELETLLAHHLHSDAGLAIVPQGTPTNNTDGLPAGVARGDDADATFSDPFTPAPHFELTADPLAKRDGQWLAEWLGVDPAVLEQVAGADGADQLEARAMQTALWPATLGYMVGSLLEPLLDEPTQLGLRSFFTRFVSGRGPVPAVRVGKQPYGILPTTAFSRLRLDDGSLDAIGVRLGIARSDWDGLTVGAARITPSAAPFQTLLDVLGLQATSVEYRQRYAESLDDLYNRANLVGLGERMLVAYGATGEDAAGRELLQRLGAPAGVEPKILQLFFFSAAQLLQGPLIESRPLSETAPLQDVTTDGRNYIAWLDDAARVSLDTVRREQGFATAPPDALLYLLLRHAVLLGYWDTAVRLDVDAGVLDASAAASARSEPSFVHVAADGASESRYAPLYRTEPRVTGRDDMLVADYIPTVLGSHDATSLLVEQLAALDALRDCPTARLERLLAEHVDCCSYRLDAWLVGLAHARLASIREQRTMRNGLHVGAYGWLEEVRPKPRPYQAVELTADQAATFPPPLLHDPTNGGFIHAPSPNHAVTAAILRAGYLANAAPEAPDALAVRLTSGRVRTALALLEGMRNGQSLGALLGYQLERRLHDSHGLAEVDSLVYALRKAFPLVADRLDATHTDADIPIEVIEARNVVDGLALALQVRRTGIRTYPYGASLPDVTDAQAAAADAEVERLLDTNDAVSDLVLAEAVHQAALGNHERAAASLDSASGTIPPEPAVVDTPRSGAAITHRVALQLEPGRDPLQSPVPGLAVTPRAIAQPAINAWLAARLPSPEKVACAVTWTDVVAGTERRVVVTQKDLGLQPLDLVSVLRTETEQAMTELDDRVLRRVLHVAPPRPDEQLSISYTERFAQPDRRSFFELSPLVSALRAIVLRSRPLRATDVALRRETSTSQDELVHTDDQAAIEVRNRLVAARDALRALAADPRLADPVAHRAALVQAIDDLLQEAADRLARAAAFGLAQSGFGDLFAWRTQAFRDLLAAAAATADRLSERLARFEQLLAEVGTATSNDEKMLLLQRAELLVATVPTSPLPPTPAAYEPIVAARGGTFAGRRDQLIGLASTTQTTLSGLVGDVAAIPLADIDAQGLDLTPFYERIVGLAGSLRDRLAGLADQIDGRLDAANAALGAYATATSDTARLAALEQAHTALLGNEARVLGEFPLPPAQAAEWGDALQASTSGELFSQLTDRPFPVDDWLHGVARVREKVRQLEQVVLLGGTVGPGEPALTPTQLPYSAGEPWLGLEFPVDAPRPGEHLLYTAHYAVPFDGMARQCGLLLDEWTEVLPAEHETTGIAFHYDRPSSEPPQSWLLAVPPDPSRSWAWADLVDAVGETLDLARLRAVEPDQIDALPWARLLPAVIGAATLHPITIAVDFARANGLVGALERDG